MVRVSLPSLEPVSVENARAVAAETVIVSTATAETTARVAGDATNAAAVVTETAARVTAVSAVSGSISGETAARIAADNTLTTNVATNASDITSEATARAAAVAAEAAIRAAADNTLTTNVAANSSAISGETARATAAEAPLGINPSAGVYTADPTGVADATAQLQAALNAVPSGGMFRPNPGATYKISDTLTAPVPMVINLSGVTITQVTAGKGGIIAAGSNTFVVNGKLVGPQSAVYTESERGFQSFGTVGTPLSNVKVIGTEVSGFGGHGVWLSFVNDFLVTQTRPHDIYRAGITALSCVGGVIDANNVKNITGSIVSNAYGIVVSRGTTGSLATDPRSSDIAITNNVVIGVTNWEGIDTHSGLRLTVANNTVRGCLKGIVITSSGSTPDFPPLECNVTGNIIDSGVTNGSYQTGILFTGATSSGTRTLCATGSITGNTVVGYGDQSNSIDGAIKIQDTEGVAVTGNVTIAPGVAGIMVYHDNYDFVISGNTVIDAFSNTVGVGEAAGIWVSSNFNKGFIGGNVTATTGTVSATYLLTRGIEVSNQANNNIELGTNFSTSSTPLLDSGSKTSATFRTPLTSFVGSGGQNPVLISSTTSTVGIAASQVILRSKDGGYGSGITFQSRENGTSTYIAQAVIEAEGSASWADVANSSSLLRFSTVAAGTLAEAFRFTSGGDMQPVDGKNMIFGTTTGTKLGTGTTQKIGFWGAAPVVQTAGATDVLAGLVTIGFRAASANPPLNLGTGALTSGAATHTVGANGVSVVDAGVRTGVTATQVSILGGAAGNGAGVRFASTETGTSTTIAQATIEAEGSLSWNSVANASSFLRFSTTAAGTLAECFRFTAAGDMQPVDGKNFILNGTTGMKLGTGTGQRLGFWNATPVVQPTGTPAVATDLASVISLANSLRSNLLLTGMVA